MTGIMACQQGSGKRWELHREGHAASTPSAGANTPQDQNRQEETPLAQRLGAIKAILNESQRQSANIHEGRTYILAASPDGSKPALQLALHKACKATTSPAKAQSTVLPSPAQDRLAAKQTRRLVPCLPVIGVAGSSESKAVAQTALAPKKQEGEASTSISGDRSVFSFL